MTSDSASRVTRSRRSLWRSTLLFIAVLAGVTVLRAQETAPSPPSTAAPAGASGTASEETAAAGASDDAESASGPATDDEAAAMNAKTRASGAQDGKPAGKVGPTQDHFEPTEKVRADFDVSFPVDI
jgi:hypothetical protein